MFDSSEGNVPPTVESVKIDVVKDTAWYGLATYLAQGLGVISAILIRHFLGPAGMGVWSALMLLPTYTNYSHLGVFNAAEREIPFLSGKQQWEQLARVRNVTFTTMLFASLLSTLAVLAVALWQSNSAPPDIVIGLHWMSLVVLAQLGFAYFGILARTAKRFYDLGILAILGAAANILAILVLASRFKVNGMLLATTAVYMFMTLYLVFRLKIPIHPVLDWRQAGNLLVIGLPIMLYGVITNTLLNIDEITTIALLGTTPLGFYTLATMVKTYAWTVPSIIGIVIYPRLQERYGATGDAMALKNMLLYPIAILASFTPILVGALYFGTVFLAHSLLPEYVSGLASVRNMVVGTFFLAITLPAAQLLVTLNKQVSLMVIGAIGVVLAWALNLIFVQMGMGIAGIALGTSGAYFVTASATLILAVRRYLVSLSQLIQFLIRTYLPFVYATGALFAIDSIVSNNQPQLVATITIIIAKLLAFAIACLPLLWYADRQMHLISLLRDALATSMQRWGWSAGEKPT